MTRPVIGKVLWRARAEDDTGDTVRLCAKVVPAGLAVLISDPVNGTWSGLVLNRSNVQELRHVLSGWLVDAAPDTPR